MWRTLWSKRSFSSSLSNRDDVGTISNFFQVSHSIEFRGVIYPSEVCEKVDSSASNQWHHLVNWVSWYNTWKRNSIKGKYISTEFTPCNQYYCNRSLYINYIYSIICHGNSLKKPLAMWGLEPAVAGLSQQFFLRCCMTNDVKNINNWNSLWNFVPRILHIRNSIWNFVPRIYKLNQISWNSWFTKSMVDWESIIRKQKSGFTHNWFTNHFFKTLIF